MTTSPPAGTTPRPLGRLARALADLAATPDDSAGVDTHLVLIARLGADLVEPVDYASVTTLHGDTPTTVAASNRIALDVDAAQYADGAGPCLDALEDGKPLSVPDLGTVMAWPGFRDTAWRLGIRASLSIPLFAGSGNPIAALNLYARRPDALTDLTRAVWAIYDGAGATFDGSAGQNGSGDLLTGLTAAFHTRDLIQRAIGIIMSQEHVTAEGAYLRLRMRAAETGAPLLDAARTVVDTEPSDQDHPN